MNLITGGTGLVGSHLILHFLQNGESVRALYRSESAKAKTKNLFAIYEQLPLFEKIEWVQGDILDIPSLELAFQGVKNVYHCAALISFDPKDEDLLRKTNIEGTANMVNCALAAKVSSFLFVSSIAAMGDSIQKNQEINEKTEWNPEKPHSDYAISKFGAEMEVWRGYQEGLSTIILNPGVVLGCGFWDSGSGLLFRHAEKEIPFYTHGITGFIAVEDVVQIAFALTQKRIIGEQFCLVAENCSNQNILTELAKGLSKKPPKWQIQSWVLAILWRIDWLFSTIFGAKRTLSRPIAKALYSNDHFSNAKITETLGYQFQPIAAYIQKMTVYFMNRKN